MTAPATPFVTYLWHYMLARFLYDELVRPLVHGRVSSALLVAAAVITALALARVVGRRR